ncbi:MAG: hypothetical protein KF709_04100 [Gemmatimonadaceae bacterium]|nr:hypothetical protein [Gemmatimonadaceae bacterium]
MADAIQATQLSRYAEEQVRARAAAVTGVAALLVPDDLAWLCLQPPAVPAIVTRDIGPAGRVELRWWSLGGGRVRAELVGVGARGVRARLLGRLRVDSLPPDDLALGCPTATRLNPDGADWLLPAPVG